MLGLAHDLANWRKRAPAPLVPVSFRSERRAEHGADIGHRYPGQPRDLGVVDAGALRDNDRVGERELRLGVVQARREQGVTMLISHGSIVTSGELVKQFGQALRIFDHREVAA